MLLYYIGPTVEYNTACVWCVELHSKYYFVENNWQKMINLMNERTTRLKSDENFTIRNNCEV